MNFLSQLFIEYPWALPLFIFCARICDVTFGTMRMRFVSRGYRLAAAAVGFVEVLIWVTTISQLIQNLDRWYNYVAYAGGYAAGTYLGLLLEGCLALGKAMVRVFPQRDASQLIEILRQGNFGVTSIDGQGARGPVKVIFTIVPRHALPEVVGLIKRCSPNAFFTIEEVAAVHQGIAPVRETGVSRFLKFSRPGK